MSAMPDAVLAVIPAPWGPLHLAATERGVVAVESLATTEDFVERLEGRIAGTVATTGPRRGRTLVGRAAAQLSDYLAGVPVTFDVPLDLLGRPTWDRDVLGRVQAVPWGAVTSYGRVARRVGRPGAARAVGGAIGRNPVGIVVPCHRVVAADGSLGGYGGDWFGSRETLLDIKRELLRIEGVELPARSLFD
jgi:methylated-DNA-[protein]-cysteine S-methyltransferase